MWLCSAYLAHPTSNYFLRWIMVPVEIPAVLQGRPQRLKRMSVDYMVTNSTPRTTRISSSEILMSDRRGRSEKIYSNKQERGATVWTTFDLVVPNPPVITGSLFLRVTMQYAERQAPDYENKPKGDRVFIGTIGAVIGD